MIHRDAEKFLRSAIALSVALLFVACQSDEESLAEFYQQGQDYVQQEMYEESVIEFKNVLKINPNHADAHYELAKAYLKLSKLRDAYWEMSETVRLGPDNTEAVLSFGALSLIAKDGEQALSMAELAMEADPESHQGFFLMAKALELQKRSAESEEYYLKAVELDTENYATTVGLATYYAGQPDGREKAEPWFWRGVERFASFRARTDLAKFLVQDPARTDEAEAMFRQAIEQDSEGENLEEGYMNLARLYFGTDRGEDGVATIEAGRELVRDPTSLIFMLATYYRVRGDLDRAESLIRDATQVDPSSPEPHLALSVFLGGRDNLQGALSAAEDAVAADPSRVDARLRRAEILVDMGYREAGAQAAEDPERDLAALSSTNPKIREGLEVVDQILKETPFQPQAQFVRGKAYLAQGESKKGIEAFRAAAEGRPDWAQAHFALGSALASQNEASLARVEIARALELDPGMDEARRVLATVHQALSEHEYAIEQGNRYLKVRPDSNATRVLVAQSLIRLGKRERALRELEKVPADQRDAGVLFALGRIHANLQQPAKARKYLMQVLEVSPGNHKVLRTLFSIDKGNAENFVETRQLIVAAVDAHPDDSELAQLHGMVLYSDGNLEAAETEFVRATELDPDDIEAYQQLARYYSVTGRADETIATYRKAVEIEPTSARLHHFLALLYENQGEVDLAQSSYENAIKYDESHAFAKNNLAYLLADSGKDLDRALDLARDAKARLPNDANAADTLGWVLYKRGVYGAAVGYLKESVENIDADDPALGVIRYHLALAYEADGNKGRAVEVLNMAVDDLDRRLRAARAEGQQEPQSPPWEGEARSLLDRLTANG